MRKSLKGPAPQPATPSSSVSPDPEPSGAADPTTAPLSAADPPSATAAEPDARPAPHATTSAPRPATVSRVVLLVEDQADVRHVVAGMLTRAGHVVHEAGGLVGAEAVLDQVADLDLLLTDLMLPGANGVEVARQVRRRHPDLPVLYMSGYAAHLLAGGEAIEPLLQKPFTARTLLAALDALFTA